MMLFYLMDTQKVFVDSNLTYLISCFAIIRNRHGDHTYSGETQGVREAYFTVKFTDINLYIYVVYQTELLLFSSLLLQINMSINEAL